MMYNSLSDKFSFLMDKVVNASSIVMSKLTEIYNTHFREGVNNFFGALREDLIDKGKNFFFKLIPTVGNVLLGIFAGKKLFDFGNKFLQKSNRLSKKINLGL